MSINWPQSNLPDESQVWRRKAEEEIEELRRSQRTQAVNSIAAAKNQKSLDRVIREVGLTIEGQQEAIQEAARIPAAPANPSASSDAYFDDYGYPQAVVHADSDAVELDTQGEPLSIRNYELFGRKDEAGEAWTLLAETYEVPPTFSYSPLPAGETWAFKIRAVSSRGQGGEFSAPVTVTLARDTVAPPQPAALTGTSRLGQVIISWSGKSVGGADQPADFSHAEVLMYSSATGGTGTVIGRMGSQGDTFVAPEIPYNATRWYSLIAVDYAGNRSPESARVAVTTQPLVDTDIIGQVISEANLETAVQDKIQQAIDDAQGASDAADQAAQDAANANAAAIQAGLDAAAAADDADAALTAANGKNTIYYQTSEPTGGTYQEGDTWFDTDDGNKIYVYDGGTWKDAQDDDIFAALSQASSAASAASAAASAASAAQNTADSKNRVVRSASAASSPANYKAGDVWYQYSGANVIGFWIHNGSSWISQALANQVIATLDAAKINTGYLSSARIEARSLSADKLAVNSITAASGVIANAAIDTAQIANTAITNAKIANLDAAKINTGFLNAARIEARSLSADKLAVNSITAASGVIADLAITNAKIASVDAAKITTGFLDAARIQAQSITADKLLVGDFQNYFNDPTFSHPSGYSPWTKATHTNPFYNRGIRKAGTGAQNGNYYSHTDFNVRAGDRLRFDATFVAWSGPTATGQASIYLQQLKDGAWSYLTRPIIGTTPAGNVEYPYSGEVVVPAGVTKLRLGFYTESNMPSTQQVLLAELTIRRMTAGELIVDGAITADKVATNAITSDKIIANAITTAKIAALQIEAGHIKANAITSDKIIAGAIDGKTITGATIRTAATGQRLQLDTSGLRSYNASNVITGQLLASSGGLLLSGKLRSGSGNQRAELESTQIAFYAANGLKSGSVYAANPGGSVTTGLLNLTGGNRTLVVGPSSLPGGGTADFQAASGYIPDMLEAGGVRLEGGIVTSPNLPMAYAAGAGLSGANAGSSGGVFWDAGVTVTLPAGRFTRAPIVTATSVADGPVLTAMVVSRTATSITVRTIRFAAAVTAGTAFHWTASQAAPDSSGG